MKKLLDISEAELAQIGLGIVQKRIDKVKDEAFAIVLAEIVRDTVLNGAHNSCVVQDNYVKITLDRDLAVFKIPYDQFSDLYIEKTLELSRFE